MSEQRTWADVLQEHAGALNGKDGFFVFQTPLEGDIIEYYDRKKANGGLPHTTFQYIADLRYVIEMIKNNVVRYAIHLEETHGIPKEISLEKMGVNVSVLEDFKKQHEMQEDAKSEKADE